MTIDFFSIEMKAAGIDQIQINSTQRKLILQPSHKDWCIGGMKSKSKHLQNFLLDFFDGFFGMLTL